MQCTLESDSKMKTLKHYKNPFKEPNLDFIVDELCSRLQGIKDQEKISKPGMPTCSTDQTEAVKKYYAAFPALKKGLESPLQYYLPPPVWCRKSNYEEQIKMQSEYDVTKDWNSKNKKFSIGKERRNSYNGQKKNRKRYNRYSRLFDSKECLPEWVTHEGVWDMETQDPVKEFIRAIALDEGYGTCENTVTDEIKEISQFKFRHENMVPDWEESLDFGNEWFITEELDTRIKTPLEEEMYAKFEAKFDRSIEALWSKEQNTPDDEYQDLPIDFQDLLSSPSDRLFANPSIEKCSMLSLTESIWSNTSESWPPVPTDRPNSPSKIAESLHDRFRPLNLTDNTEPEIIPPELESFTLYEGEEIYDALSTVAQTMKSYSVINHSRDRSGFAEVPPRRCPKPVKRDPEPKPASILGGDCSENLLKSAKTHFRPIRREPETEPIVVRHADGDTFNIRGSIVPADFQRSESGYMYLENCLDRYLEYRLSNTIDYARLGLRASQKCAELEDPAFRLRFPLRQNDQGVQTDEAELESETDSWNQCDECSRSAKKMRPSVMESIWSDGGTNCGTCAAVAPVAHIDLPTEELSKEWEELLSDISAVHAQHANGPVTAGDILEETLVSADRKRRHSAALRCTVDPDTCTHPHARFLHCCGLVDRPLTR